MTHIEIQHGARTAMGVAMVACCVAIFPIGCGVSLDSHDAEDLTTRTDEVIFGSDDRVEYGSITNSTWLRQADATAALFDASKLSCAGGSCQLATTPFATGLVDAGVFVPLCSGVRFRDQAQGADCTAVLIGPDVFATAGHCVGCSFTVGACTACTSIRAVFGFNADASGTNVTTTVPDTDVYSCVSAEGIFTSTEDVAVFHVDRVVQNRVSMIARYSGTAPVGLDLLAAGHPDGLPLKFASGGQVREDLVPASIGTSLDLQAGNSGSPLFNASLGIVEAIHVRRPYWHFNEVSDGSGGTCAVYNVCDAVTGCNPNFGTSAWAEATRLSWAAQNMFIPLHPALNVGVPL